MKETDHNVVVGQYFGYYGSGAFDTRNFNQRLEQHRSQPLTLIRFAHDKGDAHADRDELLTWIGKLDGGLQQIFLVHGDLDQSEALAEGIRQTRVCDVTIPNLGDEVQIG